MQGDITEIKDSNGNNVASYVYDAWGNILSATGTMAEINPFRYRGYYYDSETGWYYLNSRYYDPIVGRFINSDDLSYLDPESLNGLNLYTYCLNNPVMYIDSTGNFILSVFIATLVISTIVGGVFGGLTAASTGQSILGGVIGGALAGLLSGLAVYFATPLLLSGGLGVLSSVSIAFGGGFVAGVVQYSINQKFNNNNWNFDDAMLYGASVGVRNIGALFVSTLAAVGGTYFSELDKVAATLGEKVFEISFGGLCTALQIGIWSLLDIGVYELEKRKQKRETWHL